MENTLGKRIAAYRKNLKLTQDQLAEKLGLTAQAGSKWENDQSCPDITMLPKLADIFGVSTDALLGRQAESPVCQTVVVDREETESNGFTYSSDSGKMDFHWEGVKLEGISLACWVILTGILYLVTQLIHIDISFWNILWPSFLLVFGLFGLFPKFSAFRLGCALVGGYFLISKLQIFTFELNNGIIAAVVILLFGVALLADALRKTNSKKYLGSYTDAHGKIHHGKKNSNYSCEGDTFSYEANFGESTQIVVMEKLRYGSISTNFGEYTVDLSGVAAVENNCRLEAECSFGELTILVPRIYTVLPDSSTSFASFNIQSHPGSASQGNIYLSASVNFGDISVKYI